MEVKDAPSIGDPKRPLRWSSTLIRVPVCRNLHEVMRGMLKNYPQVD